MLKRRSFLIGSCCALQGVVPAVSSAQRRTFICGTVDRPVGPPTAEIQKYAGGTGVGRLSIESVITEFKITPYGTMNFGHRWLRSDGMTPHQQIITLGVHFLNGSDAKKRAVREGAMSWLEGELGTRMAFMFDVPRANAQITVNFDTDANNSIVGRASAQYAQSRETMNIADVIGGVIKHEFGHAIGLQHEHQNPNVNIRWNRAAVLADMARQGWTSAMVEQNIFARLGQTYACIGDPGFNRDSIMLYPIPPHWTLDGFNSGDNDAISDRDRRCLAGVYRV